MPSRRRSTFDAIPTDAPDFVPDRPVLTWAPTDSPETRRGLMASAIILSFATGATLALGAWFLTDRPSSALETIGSTEPGTILMDSHGTITVAPCEHETDTGCYWDADSMGNGEGVSFVSWPR
jgi:hypothetical protein